MRNAFVQQLEQLAESDDRIVLLMGDIGNRMFDRFKARHPDRFYNCGVAEANMMSVAAGMALCGLRPIVYTIVPFVTARCLEQIRVDVCYHQVPVTIVGVGGGLSYAGLGTTHHSCEDIAFLRVLPHMKVVCPGDSFEVRAALAEALGQDSPVYLRLGKKGEPVVHDSLPDLEIGKGLTLRRGDEIVILSTGNLLPTAVEVSERLEREGHRVRLVSHHTVKPLDEELLAECFSVSKLVVTLEEHSVLGGLGGAVAEWLADQGDPGARLLRIGTPDAFLHRVANQADARRSVGLDADSIVAKIREAYDTLAEGTV